MIAWGMWVQAIGIGITAVGTEFLHFAFGSFLLGAGTAMVYPTLLAAIGDVAHPSWRASSVGIYRLWRDSGYAVGALIAGFVADAFGLSAAVWVVAALTLASGLVVSWRMREVCYFFPNENIPLSKRRSHQQQNVKRVRNTRNERMCRLPRRMMSRSQENR